MISFIFITCQDNFCSLISVSFICISAIFVSVVLYSLVALSSLVRCLIAYPLWIVLPWRGTNEWFDFPFPCLFAFDISFSVRISFGLFYFLFLMFIFCFRSRSVSILPFFLSDGPLFYVLNFLAFCLFQLFGFLVVFCPLNLLSWFWSFFCCAPVSGLFTVACLLHGKLLEGIFSISYFCWACPSCLPLFYILQSLALSLQRGLPFFLSFVLSNFVCCFFLVSFYLFTWTFGFCGSVTLLIVGLFPLWLLQVLSLLSCSKCLCDYFLCSF